MRRSTLRAIGGVSVMLALSSCTSTVSPPTSTSDQSRNSSDTVRGQTPTAGSLRVPGVGQSAIAAVLDGDTVKVEGTDGQFTVRLIGINAPEKGECYADRATAALQSLVAGRPVSLTADVSDVDQFGRKLRFVDVGSSGGLSVGSSVGSSGEVDVGAMLIRGGFALSRRYPPDVSRSDEYDQLQAGAQAAGAGLWAVDACGSNATKASIGITQHANAAGDDNKNLNDEWVRFTNNGDSPVNFRGWVVADESASHRYSFGDFILGVGASVTLYTGCGPDAQASRYWCNVGSAVWNNAGDTVFLRNSTGNIVASLKY